MTGADGSARLLIVGSPEPGHVGAHLLQAAEELGVDARLLDLRAAWRGPGWLRRIHWHLFAKRPTALGPFGRYVLETCAAFKPQVLLCTGIAPVAAKPLHEIGRMGITRVNFLTDDPWNPRNGAAFFWRSLPCYDWVFSPRTANMGDLRACGCPHVAYLPFGYNPKLHYYEPPADREAQEKYACDLAILGGADQDRVPLALAALEAGLTIKLYGGYWDRDKRLRRYWHGFVHDRELRQAAAGATAHLCMGRKANRDEHAMRSYELPAMGAALIVEKTPDHLALFGPEGTAALYYSSIEEMVEKARRLAAQPLLAQALAANARQQIGLGKNSYTDRLREILQTALPGTDLGNKIPHRG